MIKLACFDLDGTIIENVEHIWEVLHRHFQVDDQRREEARQKFFNKWITYEEWALHDFRLWIEKGATKQEIMKAVRNIRLVKGARETLFELKKRGIKLAVISGSLNIALEKVLPEYNELFDYIYINRIFFDKDGRISSIKATRFDFEQKVQALKEIVEREGISRKETMFIGDHDNDVEVAKHAGFSIAFNSKSKRLNKVVDAVVEKDLRKVLKELEKEISKE